jgi:hypothetical protein
MVVRATCPACGADRYKKNGHTRHGKQESVSQVWMLVEMHRRHSW